MEYTQSEREQMATVLDIILRVKDAEAEGKTEYTSDEVVGFLCLFIEEKTRHARKENANEL